MAVKNMKYDYDSEILKYVKNQTPSICLEAVKQEGMALKYVHNQALDICLEAVKQNKDALLYVDFEYLEDVRKMIND